MSKHNVVKLTGREKVCDQLTELIRSGAHKLIAQGPEAEVSELLAIGECLAFWPGWVRT